MARVAPLPPFMARGPQPQAPRARSPPLCSPQPWRSVPCPLQCRQSCAHHGTAQLLATVSPDPLGTARPRQALPCPRPSRLLRARAAPHLPTRPSPTPCCRPRAPRAEWGGGSEARTGTGTGTGRPGPTSSPAPPCPAAALPDGKRPQSRARILLPALPGAGDSCLTPQPHAVRQPLHPSIRPSVCLSVLPSTLGVHRALGDIAPSPSHPTGRAHGATRTTPGSSVPARGHLSASSLLLANPPAGHTATLPPITLPCRVGLERPRPVPCPAVCGGCCGVTPAPPALPGAVGVRTGRGTGRG